MLLDHLKRKFAKLEKEYDKNPKAKARRARILLKAEKLQDQIDKVRSIRSDR